MNQRDMVAAKDETRAIWNRMAPGWEKIRDAIWSDSRSIGEWLVDKLAPQPGDTVLDIAAGVGDTGLLAARRIAPTGRVIIADFAPAMVEAAHRRAAELGIANAEFRVLDAEQMDLPTGSVDGVLCRWGYMLMLDPAAAFAETRRVLRPGKRLAFSVWAGPADNPWASLISPILVTRGLMAPSDPTAPGIFALADRDRLERLVRGAGFHEVEIEAVPMHRRFASFDAFWRYLTDLAGAVSPILRGLSESERESVQAELRAAAEPYRVGDGYVVPCLCLNAVAS